MDMSLLTHHPVENARLLTGCTEMTDREAAQMVKGQDGRASSLQRGGDRQTAKSLSVGSDLSREASSWTESELGLKAEGARGGGMKGSEGAGLKIHLKEDEEETEENHLPEKAAQVFRPVITKLPSPRDAEAFWETEKSSFLASPGVDYNQHGYLLERDVDTPPAACAQCCAGRDVLKMSVSLMTAALFFPFLVWGGFVFLPFDAPLLDGAPIRLVYTLRCSVFAAVPIILGWLLLALSRLRSGATRPLSDGNMKEVELQEVSVHQRFISDSTSLFLIYFLQLVVMAMYLSQEQLKLIPLMTIVFALGRLAYWVAAAFGSSVRSFGFGLSFLPSVAMMAANFYFIFTVEAGGSIFSLPAPPGEVPPPPAGRQRFWG